MFEDEGQPTHEVIVSDKPETLFIEVVPRKTSVPLFSFVVSKELLREFLASWSK